ncbi:hypothetical protein FSARC_13847 [Fusarium sarcochroum]|uniref:LysM domain-containing protein n=1 Tax=Fusarium sarcochroum TaxID=1208366 RepID=A0A8H4SYT0_9HYPO|nr:hypothetical protein FSARC_13847 [Fusarium sarcochroum]
MQSLVWSLIFCCTFLPGVLAQDSKPGAPVHPGQPSNCIAWHTVKQGEDCETVPKKYYITKQEFLAWNPAVSKDCLTNFWLKLTATSNTILSTTRSGKESSTSTTKIPSTKEITSTVTSGQTTSGATSKSIATTSANTTYSVRNPVSTWNITTPTTDVSWPPKATQSGQPKDCNKWHFVRGRQNCQDVLNIHSSFMKKEDFFKWNPEVHQDCSGLFVGYWYCVGIKSNSTGKLEWETATPPFTPPPEPTPYTPTKLTPANPDFTPTPSHGPMPTDCIHYHQAEANENCGDILETYSYLSKDQFFKYNPVLKNSCDGLWKGNWYCVGVKSELLMPPTVTATPSDVPGGSPKDCKAWYYTTGGETCDELANMFGTFSAKEFVSMNPTVFDDCSEIEDNTWYCVAEPDTPTTRTTDMTTPTRPATYMPTQTGIASYCKEYWLVSKKDTCKSIRQSNSISLEKLLTWNPALGNVLRDSVMQKWFSWFLMEKPISRLKRDALQVNTGTLIKGLENPTRRKILIHAFGNRTVHMDLVLTHPLREPLGLESSFRSTDPKYRFSGGGLDTSQPKYWQWRGCICHRLLPPEYKITVKFPHYAKPGDDRCCDGWGIHCGVWTRKHGKPDSCWIGVMGWLVTCRQAPTSSYAEGIKILYSTNIIHISSKPLLTNLSTLVPPQRLSMVTSLEIVFSLDNHEHRGKAVPNQQELENGLSILDTHFHCLLSLHIGLRLNLPIIEETTTAIKRRPAYLQEILHSIDAFVKRRSDLPRFGQLRDALLLSISESAYEDFKNEVRSDSQHYFKLLGVQVWRHLSSEPFMLNEEGEIINATADGGYWIWGDLEDRYEMEKRPPSNVVSCFGSS